MKSRNGGLIRPSMTSATTHHVTASATDNAHHPVNRHHSRFGRCAAHQITAARQAVRVATALTAPISATASADLAASTRTLPCSANVAGSPAPRSARTTGNSTHGASIIGSVSEEIAPSVVSTRGDSANASAAMTLEPGLPMFEGLGQSDQAPEPGDEQ